MDKKGIPENVEAREDTTAEDILRRCNNDMLKPMLTRTNSKGSRGAPSHPAGSQIRKKSNGMSIGYKNCIKRSI
ncbi:conserved hypothetical protein [Ricinus communis]|uniref:Uncharacterized protein n=1 Tax=Ricinus communis TaxID=3988 RepID=B9SJ89_RICCO|nr:conserved hypothetical protein [Ricinus communis]